MNLTIPGQSAGGEPGALSFNFTKAGFSVQQSTGTFTLRIGSGAAQTVAVGQSIGTATGPGLGTVTFSNATATAIQLTLGDFGVNQVTVSQANAQTVVGNNSGPYNFGNSQPLATFKGIDSQGRHRKSILISNLGYTVGGAAINNNVLAVARASNAKLVAQVYPQSQLLIETDDDLTVQATVQNNSTTVADQQGCALELFYSQSLQTNQ